MRNTISARRKAKEIWGMLFVLPTCLVLFLFVVYPIVNTTYLSFCDYNFAFSKKPVFAGFKNFMAMPKDIQFTTALSNTLIFTAVMFTLLIVLSLGFALLLFAKKRRSWFYRTSIFMPIVVPASLICLLFTWMLADNFGILNKFLQNIGLPQLMRNWLTTATTAKWWVIIVSTWGKVGFSTILFLSGIQGISIDIFEAAEIDGAVGWRKLFYIIIPNLTETFVVTGIWAVLQCLKLFVTPNVLTKGGPGIATLVLYQKIYNEAFMNFEMGYASSIAFVLTALVMFFSFLNMKLGKKEDY